jgi:hypothetical protein
MKLLSRMSALSLLMLGTIAAQTWGDRAGLQLPWYFLHQMVLALIPMLYLLGATLPKVSEGQRLAFIATSAFFIAVSGIAEVTAIEHRFWWFFTEKDSLLGVQLGALPIEEFIYYPLFLNLPLLFSMWLKGALEPETESRPENPGVQRGFKLAGLAFAALGALLLARALLSTAAPLDTTILPAADAHGALRYSAGPHHMGWTIVQLFGLSGTCSLIAALWTRLALRRMVVTVLCCFPFFLFAELMACGRGWWVWNDRQVLGLFTWIVPVESYAMYLTGALLPPLVMEWVRPFFESRPLTQTELRGATVLPFPRREVA